MKSSQDRTIVGMCRDLSVRFVPAALGRLPYSFTLLVLQCLTKVTHGKQPAVWPRHSYVLGSLTPFLSDLDITFWFEESPSFTQVSSLYKSWRWLKAIFPLLGEDNMYVASEVDRFLKYANPLELSRDPILLEKIKETPHRPSKEQAAIFLIRNILADCSNLNKRAKLRKKKWHQHFQAVGVLPPADLSTRALLESAVRLAGLDSGAVFEAVESIEKYLSGETPSEAILQTAPGRYLFAFITQRFVGHEIKLEANLSLIAAAQIEWEIWGLYGQFRRMSLNSESSEAIEIHISGLEHLLENSLGSLPENNRTRLRDGLSTLKEFLKKEILEKKEKAVKEYHFRDNWFSDEIQRNWKEVLDVYRGQPDLRYLEVGVWEGKSLLWMLDNILIHPSSKAVAVDYFGENKRGFFENLDRSGYSARVKVLTGNSEFLLPPLQPASFDIIYLDGDHSAAGVITDAIAAWRLLKNQGILIFDDYKWGLEMYPTRLLPSTAIDFFLHAFKGSYEVIHEDYQIVIKKKLVYKSTTMMTQMGSYSYYWFTHKLTHREREVQLSSNQIKQIENLIRIEEANDVAAQIEAILTNAESS